jgi:hypothetical protein
MSKPKIVDCFPYFNEKELLELRITMLYDHVDQFIITDADHTHSGHLKEYTCVNTLKELGIPLDKIVVMHVKLPSYEQTDNNWIRERLQRDSAISLFEDNAIYIVSDCDEIIDPTMIENFTNAVINFPQRIIRIPLAWLSGRADLIMSSPDGEPRSFNTPFMCMKHHSDKHNLSIIREAYAAGPPEGFEFEDLFPLDQYQKTLQSGWHFSWMGDTDRIKYKMKSFLHSYDKKENIFHNAIAPIYSDGMMQFLDSYKPEVGKTDTYGRSDHILLPYPIEKLPKQIFRLSKVKEFLLP